MDDELDPAFLDLDLPPHAGALGDSLGAGLNDSLDHDSDPDAPSSSSSSSHGDDLHLGAGFGNTLGAELSDLDEPVSPSRLRHSSNSTAGGGGGRARGDSDGLSTPRRRNGSGTSALAGQGQRMSLAFELASASGPAGGRTRDLMRELGLSEGEEDQHDALVEEDEGEETSFEQEQVERRLFSSQGGKGKSESFGGAPSPGRRPASRLNKKQSTASFVSFAPNERVEEGEEDQGISEEALDAALQEAATAIESSISTTSTFLSHLRQHTTVEVNPSSAAPLQFSSLEPSASSSTLATGSLQRTTSTPSPAPPPPADYTDRQPVVEALASSLLKHLYDVAAQRETQLRELTEMERVFARPESGWRAVLAGLEPLPPDPDAEGEEEESSGEPNGVLPPDAAAPTSPFLDSDAPPPLASSRPPPPPSAASLSQQSLLSLRTETSSLLSALSSITDLTQVSSALSSDAGRKLRALRAQVTTVKEELGAVERSEEFVLRYEEKQGEREREGRAAEMAKREVEKVREALEDGWERARRMLETPAQLQAVAAA
ncbi:hypothetical protein JCM8547_006226 [Rhodosporidiobolus lusitaniae]